MSKDSSKYDNNEDKYQYGHEPLPEIAKDIYDRLKDKLTSLFPKKDQYEDNAHSYNYSNDPDYSSGIIRSKNHLRPLTIAGRVFLAGSVAAGITYAWINRDSLIDLLKPSPATAAEFTPVPTSHQIEPTLTPTPTPEFIPPPPTYTRNELGVPITYDDQNNPLSYNLNGEEIIIDQSQLKELQLKAKEQGLPQLLISVDAPLPFQTSLINNFENGIDRPKLTQAPEGLLSKEELSDRGITIIQGEEVKVYLRESAFLPGAPLDTFTPDGKNNLTIVLVDGPTISGQYMSDPKYDQVRPFITNNIDVNLERYRQSQIKYWHQKELDSIQQLQDMVKNNNLTMVYSIQNLIIYDQVTQLDLISASTEDLAIASAKNDIGGLYVPSTRTAYISVGSSEEGTFSDTKVIIYIDKDGNIQTTNCSRLGGTSNFIPQESQNYPRPNDFSYFSQNGESAPTEFPNQAQPYYLPTDTLTHYAYGGQTPGLVFRHELYHDWKTSAHPSDSYLWDRSEWSTDMSAMGDINRAFRQFEESNYEDDSLYWLIFEVKGNFIIGQLPNPIKA